MFKLTREFHFSAGHTLRNYVGKCANLHGHNYRCLVTLEGVPNLETDMLIDFVDFKDVVGTILEQYDHHFIIDSRDERCEALKAIDPEVLEVPYNPTVEALARDIQDEILQAFFPGYPPNEVFTEGLNHYQDGMPVILDVTVQLWETDDCSAVSYSRDNSWDSVDGMEAEDSVRKEFAGMDSREAKLKLFAMRWEEWKSIWEETFDYRRGHKRLWLDKQKSDDRDFNGYGDGDPNPYKSAGREGETPTTYTLKGNYPAWERS